MLVLDYPKLATDNSITIPPFHTGHLGFLPDTPVHMYLTHPQRKGTKEYSELLITPFQRNVGEMMRISCIMEDRPGVVERLIDAVSELNVNIVTQESASINHLNHHLVSMIVDLSSSYLPRSEPTEVSRLDYADFRGLLPLDDTRVIELFESVLINCGDLIVWDNLAGAVLPRIKLERIHTQSGVAADATAFAIGTQRFHVKIDVPNGILGRIRTDLGVSRSDDVTYLILSETEQRVLRVVFFRQSTAARIVHLAFYHQDAPKALSGILRPLARARFNIITSLLRKETNEESVWEALLEYRGTEPLPAPEQRSEWAAELVVRNSRPDEIGGLRDSQVSVGRPRYPKLPANVRVPLNEKLAGSFAAAPPVAPAEVAEQSRSGWPGPAGAGEDNPRARLIASIERRRSGRPVVFISFPGQAQVHARVLSEALVAFCDVTNGMTSEGQPILDEVVEKIRSADLFVGIWHHDGEASGQVSPWMPFEYGVALAARKPAVVVHSELVAERIWKRINPGLNHPAYSDVTFAAEMVPKIVNVVQRRLGSGALRRRVDVA